ncbi:MAG: nicotinate phosphoribosyltransferase [Candidatus Handelsmanbacteria bacterium RIFCSPLOWO2_12_FULL_64_10]|uniref:Nicotinate phosphoribosyltransferase n=1 Tax=Handelsmanbacteria sp. (strain RIFCSPLOWO2_12_FULL_64_10) TaxID=1817868 RepID=A0A1F6C3L3_HANXR|nr:MAG: nicotinate phosphoribosyltransferase [Candidatus Handelsmanbacteria bacterium RIFCSPLOWO2_12_FULL_64_10]
MPIVESLLDTDFYKFTMGQVAYLRYPDVTARYAFKNRTQKARLAEVVDEAALRRELDHARTLRFTEEELRYLRGVRVAGGPVFREAYVAFLKGLRLPEYHLERIGGAYRLEFPGRWCEAIHWETIALSIVHELYCRGLVEQRRLSEREAVLEEGRARLGAKVLALRERPEVRFADFGGRRRFSRAWQMEVLRRFAEGLPGQLLGTSNVEMAFRLGLTPIGTMGHEVFMALSGIAGDSEEAVRASHNRTLREWWEECGPGLSIALTDTYGTDFFFQDMRPEQAAQWQGLRHDSGDPVAFGERAVAFYQGHGIDAGEKLLVFSDGLDVGAMLRIAGHFEGRIRVGFGWGTNLTNDLGLGPLSIVVKMAEANGRRTVKLSDNLAKAVGEPEDIERFKRIFGYTGTTFEACRY